uniref:Uncharacterized protein n=2 Tax=Hemiselmis andersenii TaxID=464988 RepID=A0A7S1MYL1_HEMAN|mmetsp:Transcript_8721/g.21392  ORF Transcript_8721/g.21392 Transcript_8721/m.21392 type:complete len:205 (+) Transcript_8721:33-647(+)
MVRASTLLLGGLSLLSAAEAFHAGLLVVPEFDEVVMLHLPPTGPNENCKPNMMHKSGSEQHLFDLPKFHKPHGEAHKDHEQEHSARGLQRMNSVNEKLIKADLKHLADGQEANARFHAGSWLNEEPTHLPNFELEPIGYSRKWLGEEKLGGGWSSDDNPLSGDREFLIKKMKTMAMDDHEKEEARGLVMRTAQDGGVYVMPKKA